jgi:hypothetical protein
VIVCASLGERTLRESDCLAILVPVLAGYAVACLAYFPVKWFYNSLCKDSGLDNDEKVTPKVPHLVIGTFERVLTFFLVWLMPVTQVGVVLLAWMTAKLARQRREQADQKVRARTTVALITGTLSLGFGVVGGAIAKFGPKVLLPLMN